MEKRNHIGDEVKDRIARYWSLRAEGFETQRLREYESEKKLDGWRNSGSICRTEGDSESWMSGPARDFLPVF